MILEGGSEIAEHRGEGGPLSEPDLIGLTRGVVRAFIKRTRQCCDEEELLGVAWEGVAAARPRVDPSRHENAQRSYIAKAALHSIMRFVSSGMLEGACRTAHGGPRARGMVHRDDLDTQFNPGPEVGCPRDEMSALQEIMDRSGITDPLDRRLASAAWAGGPDVGGISRDERRARLGKMRTRIRRSLVDRGD